MLEFAKLIILFSGFSLMALGQQSGFQPQGITEEAQGRHILDWIGLGTGADTDPYLARINSLCLNGDLAECFKSRALNTFEEFFNKPGYVLSENAKVLRLPESQLRHLSREAYEYSESPRSDDQEWDQLLKFAQRKVEKFLKSTVFELEFDDQVTARGKYSPRFIDEIVDEIDVIEDKKDSIFKRKQLKKLFIPLLLVLKLFKLKLLLFLPLILGLSSFKNILGFLAMLIPGIIAYFNFCKPGLKEQGGSFFGGPQYSPTGVAYPHHHHRPSFSHDYSDYPSGHYRNDEESAQNLAYNGWSHYRNNDKEIEAETTSKKSILPDS